MPLKHSASDVFLDINRVIQ